MPADAPTATATATPAAVPPQNGGGSGCASSASVLLSTASRLSNDPDAGDEHHLAALAILSRLTATTTTATATATATKAGGNVGGSPSPSRPSPPPDPREVEEALGAGGLNFLTRLVSTYVSANANANASAASRSSRRVGEGKGPGVRAGAGEGRGEGAGTGTTGGAGGGPGRAESDPKPASSSDADAYLSLAVSVASYLASGAPGTTGPREDEGGGAADSDTADADADADVAGPEGAVPPPPPAPPAAIAASASGDAAGGARCRVVLPAVFDARLLSRLIDALVTRTELLRLPVGDVDGRVLSVFTGAALHLVVAAGEGVRAGTEVEEEIIALLPRCMEAAVARCRRTSLDYGEDVDDDGGAARRRYSEGLASFLRSVLLLRRRRTRRSHSSSRPLLLPPTSALLDLLEIGSARGWCCVDLHEVSLLWTTEALVQEVAVEGRRRTGDDENGDEGPGLADLLRSADRRASLALRRSLLLGTMGMTVKSNSNHRKESRPATDDVGGDDAAAARLRNASYGALASAMEACGGRWLLDLDTSSVTNGSHRGANGSHSGVGSTTAKKSVGRSLSALVRMACGELRIVVEEAAASSSASPPSTVRASSVGKHGGSLEVASHCVRAIVAAVGLLVEVSSAVAEEEDFEGPPSSAAPSPRPRADWEELLTHRDGINSLLEIRGSLSGALGACLAFLASMRPHPSGGVEGEGRPISCVPEQFDEGRELLGLLCSRCAGALLAETEVEEVVAATATAAASSSFDGDEGGGAAAAVVVADAVRNAVVLCGERGGGGGREEEEEEFPAAVVVGGTRTTTTTTTTTTAEGGEEEEESAAITSSVAVEVEVEEEPLALLLPALAKMLAPADGDGEAAGTLPSSSSSRLVAERLARDRVVVGCVASYVCRVVSSCPLPRRQRPSHPPSPDGGGGVDDATRASDEAKHGGDGATAPPHAGLRWALLVLERWWWWWHRRRDNCRRRGRSSTGSTSSLAGYDDGEDYGEGAAPFLLLGAVAECAGALTDRLQMRARARQMAGPAGIAKVNAPPDGEDEDDGGDSEERQDRISLCIALQTWFSIWGDAENNILLDGPSDDAGRLHRGDDGTLLAIVSRAMETTFSVPGPGATTWCPAAGSEEEGFVLEVSRTAATIASSVSGRSQFDRIVGFGGVDGASIEALWMAVGWWSRRVQN